MTGADRRSIGAGVPCFVIAEAGVNHNGDTALAHRLVDVAAEAGADAVKFQSFRAESLASTEARKAAYQVSETGGGESQLEMLQRLELDVGVHEELARHCEECGIIFLSTPFDCGSADLLEKLNVAFFKISSGDLTNIPLLRHIARKRTPIILSTGMSDMDEVAVAVECIAAAGNKEIILLHCVSDYPAPADQANLRAMQAMRERFGFPVGFSDHTLGLEVALAAVALGAAALEKHLTLDRTLPGPDHRVSLEPQEFRELVCKIRIVESALGDGVKQVAASERDNRNLVRRSLFAAVDMPAGTLIREEMLECKRPADGIPASECDSVVGRRVRRSFKVGEKLAWERIE